MGDLMRSGLDELVFFTGAGDRLVTSVAAAGAVPEEEVSYFEGADGQSYVEARTWRFAPQVASARVVATLQRWRREGKRVGCIGLGPVPLLWRELVPVQLEEAGGERGRFGGKRVRMVTRLVEAAVERSADLLAGTVGESQAGGSTRWRAALPLAGRLLQVQPTQASVVTARIYDAAGAQLAEVEVPAAPGDPIYIELLEGVHEVEVEAAGARPPVHLDADSFALTFEAEDESSVTFQVHGRGEVVEEEYTLVGPLGGEYTRTRYVETSAALLAGRVTAEDETTYTLSIDDERGT